MNTRVFIGILILLVWACSPVRETAKTSALLTPKSQDSTEYEITVIDFGFDQWYQLNYSPSKDLSNEYYRYKNIEAVAAWNDYYRSGRFSRVIESSINYWPDIDYGIEVNRILYWYFRYVTEKYDIRLFQI